MPSISDFTFNNNYTTMLARMTNNAVDIRINSNVVTVENSTVTKARNAVGSVEKVIDRTLKPVADNIIELTEYMAPTTAAINSIYDIGKQFDDIIKDNIAVQTMHIKGSDILCSAFCVVVSFLSCETRNNLYEAILQTQRDFTALGQMTAAANELVKTYNASIAAIDTVSAATSELFSKNTRENPVEGLINVVGGARESGMSAVMAVSTLNSASKSVDNVIETFERGLNVLEGGKILQTINVSGNIWDLARSVLYSFQSQALQYADEAIDKVIQPIEDQIYDWVPTECGTRGYAWRLFQKILDGISREKQWILQLIADLFASGTDFTIEFTKFNQGSMAMLELRAFLDALKMISHRFGDLAIACGIAPCSEDSLSESGKGIADSIKSGRVVGIPSGNSNVISSLPTGDTNLDSMAATIANLAGMKEGSVIATNDTLSFIHKMDNNAPKKIKELTDLSGLGSDYSVFNDGNDINVVYTFKRMCGGE